MINRRFGNLIFLSLFLAWALAQDTIPLALNFELHAIFFSTETHQKVLLDPQVFVQATDVAAGTGPQGIPHVAGIRPAYLSDSVDTPLLNAQGVGLGFTLGQWRQATGFVVIKVLSQNQYQITSSFSRLIPGGRYSLFENHFSATGVTFTPLDGSGTTNSFTASANGNAALTVIATQPLTHANAVLLVYHSDQKDHGESRGEPGLNAHHQLIARVP